MDFEREKPDCKFSVPDRPNVRQQMDYMSLAAGAFGKNMLFRYWEGAKGLIIAPSWKCEVVPDLDVDLETVSDPNIRDVLIWAGLQVRNFINSLDELPKN